MSRIIAQFKHVQYGLHALRFVLGDMASAVNVLRHCIKFKMQVFFLHIYIEPCKQSHIKSHDVDAPFHTLNSCTGPKMDLCFRSDSNTVDVITGFFRSVR